MLQTGEPVVLMKYQLRLGSGTSTFVRGDDVLAREDWQRRFHQLRLAKRVGNAVQLRSQNASTVAQNKTKKHAGAHNVNH